MKKCPEDKMKMYRSSKTNFSNIEFGVLRDCEYHSGDNYGLRMHDGCKVVNLVYLNNGECAYVRTFVCVQKIKKPVIVYIRFEY